MTFIKKVLLVLAVGFCFFYLVQQPEGAAGAVRMGFGAVARIFNSILIFFTTLAG